MDRKKSFNKSKSKKLKTGHKSPPKTHSNSTTQLHYYQRAQLKHDPSPASHIPILLPHLTTNQQNPLPRAATLTTTLLNLTPNKCSYHHRHFTTIPSDLILHVIKMNQAIIPIISEGNNNRNQ